MKRLVLVLAALIIFLGIWVEIFSIFPQIASKLKLPAGTAPQEKVQVVTEESVTINVVKNVGPSVVTVVEKAAPIQSQTFNFGPFQVFGLPQQQTQTPQAQSIGSGFVVTTDGIIATNKHVVADTSGKYQIVTSNNKTYTVQKIYRDSLNDIALLKIDPNENKGQNLKPVILGDSGHLQVGQFVVAIGTALGEFNNTVTTGVISGLGRAITAGDQLQGYIENLNDVIQTDAAINPGNSGGPLVNSAGQVIAINTAVSQNGQNIGFALPISILKSSIDNFNQTGQFNRPYLGVAYNTISQQEALFNNVVQGAYVQSVVSGSPAEKGSIQQGDIIVKFDGKTVDAKNELSTLIAGKKAGDSVSITVWRNGKTVDLTVSLTVAPNQ
jgi:S1-C subfamily serine protease